MLDMVKNFAMNFDQFAEIKKYCDQIGILFLSTPFDLQAVDFLVSLGMPAIKIPSGEVNNIFLLRKAAEKGLPVLLSTGMSWMSEIAGAIEILRAGGSGDIGLFQCVSNYPAAPEGMNLRAITAMGNAFGIPCGFSDHSLGIDLPIASVAAGAMMIEKHFTLNRTMTGPDHAMSLEPDELKQLVESVRRIEKAMGDGVKQPVPAEFEVRTVARRSLAAARDIKAGTIVEFSDFFALRPATGLQPQAVEQLIGRKAARDISARTHINLDDFV
jgi:N-acetylneuraminate synthase/N,N'-diacetyllegionaminate synthase